MRLWEEYCTCDAADVEELLSLLLSIKGSEFAKSFGPYVESILPVWKTIPSEEDRYAVLRLIVDLETSNSRELAEVALEALKAKYGENKEFPNWLRLVGLRTKENFQGALFNVDLLSHIKKGNFIFHTSGWGVGEIIDYSPVREQLAVEFENVSGVKHVTFSNAFKTLIPLSSNHFLARRFSDPDRFEKEARENPMEVIKILLRDLGPKTAAEIKDELCELVVPEKDWQKWWQNARAKLKKDIEIESPEQLRDPFSLRKIAVAHEEQFLQNLKKQGSVKDSVLTCYNFIRDHGGKAKLPEIKKAIAEHLEIYLEDTQLKDTDKVQIYFCLDALLGMKHEKEIGEILKDSDDLASFLENIEIVAFKKQALIAIRANRNDWPTVYLRLLHTVSQAMLRDFLFKELIQNGHSELLTKGLHALSLEPWKEPEFFLWFFCKLMQEPDAKVPFADKAGQQKFAEAFLVLLNRIENESGYKDLVKKMHLLLSSKRYELVRQIFNESPVEFIKEFLLLASKCHTLTDHDLKILRSLAEVVHPSLSTSQAKKKVKDPYTIWTTEEGYLRAQERAKQIGTKEIVENAREIEAARALGDLRENSEYKYALEKRSRLQGELKSLSDQLSKARIITPDDIVPGEVCTGAVIELQDSRGVVSIIKILGPWEVNPEDNILSFQSKFAQAMAGLQSGDRFKFKDENYKILSIKSIFDKDI